MDTLEELQTLKGHTDRVWSVAWSPDGGSLASCSGDKTLRIWQRTTTPDTGSDEAGRWRCTAVLEDSHTRTIRAVSWAPGGRVLASASFDGTVAVWRAHSGGWEQAATLEGHENEVKGVAWSPDGCALATCGRDRSVWVWESLPEDEFEVLDVKQGHSQDVKAVAWHPSSQLLASCSYDDSVRLWASDGDEWACAQVLEGPSAHASTVWCVAFSRDGSHLASCSDDRTVKVWAASFSAGEPSFTLVSTLTGYHDQTVYSVDWSCDDSCLATGDGSNAIHVFRRSDLCEGDPGPASCLANGDAAPEGAAAAVHGNGAAGGGRARAPWGAWGLAVRWPQAHAADVNCVRWHPTDRTLLASAGDDGCIKLWRHMPAALGEGGPP